MMDWIPLTHALIQHPNRPLLIQSASASFEMSATESAQVDDELDEAVETALRKEMADAVLLVQKSARGSSGRRKARELAAALQHQTEADLRKEMDQAALIVQRSARGNSGRRRASARATEV